MVPPSWIGLKILIKYTVYTSYIWSLVRTTTLLHYSEFQSLHIIYALFTHYLCFAYIILKDKGNTKKLIIFDHNIVRNSQICSLNKLTSKELFLLTQIPSNWQHEKKNILEKICFLIRNTTLDTKACMFQCKALHNILYVNKMLFSIWKSNLSCKLHDEKTMHLFYDCLIVKKLWNQLKSILSINLIFSISTSLSAIFGFWDLDTNGHLILNHLF